MPLRVQDALAAEPPHGLEPAEPYDGPQLAVLLVAVELPHTVIIRQQHRCRGGGGADPGGEIATHSRTSQSVVSATSEHWRRRCCVVSYIPAAEQAGDEQYTQLPHFAC